MTAGTDWRPAWPERVPMLGEYNEQPTMDREILAASAHGVDFFMILWYPQTNREHREPHQENLNVAVEQFMASPYAARMLFAIEYVNHFPFSLDSEQDWVEACRYWARCMKHDRYLRLDNRPVFKLHSVHHFLLQHEQNRATAARWIATLRRIVREEGLADPIIAGGIGTSGVPLADVAEPFDFFTTYMDVPALPVTDDPYPYERLLQMARDAWTLHAEKGTRSYVPYLPVGWDPRPWRDPRPSFELPDRTQWTHALEAVKQALDTHENLGIPLGPDRRQKAFLIYAWNEFGEGGFVAPTQGEGTMKLDAIRAVFGTGNRSAQSASAE
jgi:hypothetical protein